MRHLGKTRVSKSYFIEPVEYPATERQKELVRKISEEFGIDPPKELNRNSCRQFISNHQRRMPRKESGEEKA